jgi:hypothetical protein
VIAELDRPPLSRRPDGCARADVDGLAPALHHMADDPAVA